MNTLHCLWSDESAFIISAELILWTSIVVLGLIVGLTIVRDVIITELSDTATAFGHLNQSVSFGGAKGHASSVAGSSMTDRTDF